MSYKLGDKNYFKTIALEIKCFDVKKDHTNSPRK